MKKNKVLLIEDILKILPHRYPFVLIDRAEETVPAKNPEQSSLGRKVRAIKNVSFNEQFFSGHFPHRPVMPGVLIIESMAQAAAIACARPGDTRKDVAIGRISEVRVRRPVIPGDQLVLEAEVLKDKGTLVLTKISASVDGEPVTEVEILAFVTDIES